MIRSTFGAPSGAMTALGKSGFDSVAFRPITPRNGWSGTGRISEPLAGEVCPRAGFETDKAAEVAASAEPPSRRSRRGGPSFGYGLRAADFDIAPRAMLQRAHAPPPDGLTCLL